MTTTLGFCVNDDDDEAQEYTHKEKCMKIQTCLRSSVESRRTDDKGELRKFMSEPTKLTCEP